MREGQEPPEAIRAWMDRLSVPHHYDPETGFIVADRTTALPGVFAVGDEAAAVLDGGMDGVVIAVATADRCAPCQQYKLDALNDERVIGVLGGLTAVHVEVDRQPELAERSFGSLGIPMTYAFRDGEMVGVLRGQKSAEELLAWLDEVVG